MEQLVGILGQFRWYPKVLNVDYYIELLFLYRPTPKLNETSSSPQTFLPIEMLINTNNIQYT